MHLSICQSVLFRLIIMLISRKIPLPANFFAGNGTISGSEHHLTKVDGAAHRKHVGKIEILVHHYDIRVLVLAYAALAVVHAHD